MIRWVFTNDPGDLGSIPGHVRPKTLKMVLDTSLLNIQQYKVRIGGKVEQSREKSTTPPTHWCSSYWKGSLLVDFYYGHQFYLLYVYIYIYIYIYKGIQKEPLVKSAKFCYPCNIKNNLCCKHLNSTNAFFNFTTKRSFWILTQTYFQKNKSKFLVRLHTLPKIILWKIRMAILLSTKQLIINTNS